MKVTKKRIRSIENYLYEIKKGDDFSIGLIGLDGIKNLLITIGCVFQ